MTGHKRCRSVRTFRFVPLVLAVVVANTHAVLAQEKDATLPANACRLELALPAGATVAIDGRSYGTQRRVVFRRLAPGRRYVSEVVVRFPDGTAQKRTVFIEGGRSLRMNILAKEADRPGLVLQHGHTDAVNSIAFSPDGKWLLTGSADKTAVLWDVSTGRRLQTYQPHLDEVTAVAFSADGSQVLTGTRAQPNPEAIVWDLATGKQLHSFQDDSLPFDPNDGISSIACSPDGRHVVIGSGRATLWSAETGRMLETLPDSQGVSSVVFTKDGSLVLVGTTLFDTRTRHRVRDFGETTSTGTAAFSPDEREVYTADYEGIILWDASTGKLRRRYNFGRRCFFITFTVSPNGKQIIACIGDTDATSIVWDKATGLILRRLDIDDGERLAAYSPDGRKLALGTVMGSVRIWNTAKWPWREERSIDENSSWQPSALLSPDDRQVIIGSGSQPTMLWDLTTGQSMPILDADLRCLSLSSDGRRLLTRTFNLDDLALWDMKTGEELKWFHGRGVAAMTPDDRTIVTDFGRSVMLWDASAGKQLGELGEFKDAVVSLDISPDGRRIVVGPYLRRSAEVLDTTTGRQLFTLPGHKGGATKLKYSPNGRMIVSKSWYESNKAPIWDASTGKLLFTLTLPNGTSDFLAFAFSSDSRQLLTGARLTTEPLKLWDTSNGRLLRSFRGHTGGVWSVGFTSDGRRAMSCSDDGTVRLWDISTGDEIVRLVSFPESNDWLAATPDGLFAGSEGGRKKVMYRVGGGLNVVPADRFFNDFYRRDLLPSILKGERPIADVPLGSVQPPRLEILSPPPGKAASPNVTIEVAIEDRGGGIGKIAIYHNGSGLLVPGQTRREGNRLYRTFDVALVEGRNHFEVRAVGTERGSWEESAELVLEYARQLPKTELYLVAAGINRYAEESINLRFAAADARSIAGVFAKRGPALYGNGKVHVTTLLDEQATKDGIHDALAKVAANAHGQDALVLFLAGHGRMVGQLYYFIPHEMRREPGPNTSFEDDIRKYGLSRDVLEDWIARVPAQKRVIIYDTCQSGGAVGSVSGSRSGFEFEEDLERMSRALGSCVIAATSATDSAQELPALGHGVLTYTLLAGLKAVDQGPLADRDIDLAGSGSVVSVRDWFGFAQDQVPAMTKIYFGQEQLVRYIISGENFPVLPLND